MNSIILLLVLYISFVGQLMKSLEHLTLQITDCGI